MLVSSILNTVSFKDISGSFPNRHNTLYNDRKIGGLTLKKYFQKFNNADSIYLQFSSDVATVPTLRSYLYETTIQNTAIAGSLVSSYSGVDDRYYFNFEISLDSNYNNKTLYFKCFQGSDTLTSEPMCVSDYSDEISRGDLKKIQYANLDINSFSDSYFIDWTALDYMYFYVEAIDEYKSDGSLDNFEDVDQKINIASKLFGGLTLKTGGIPDYLAEKIIAASMLDLFTINDIQYIANKVGEPEIYGNSTLFQLSLDLTETHTVGLNSDDLGIIVTTNTEDVIQVKKNSNVTGGGWQVENPEGFMLHSVQIKHNVASAAAIATVKCGTSIAGDDIIDEIQGEVAKADYQNKFKNYSIHFLKTDTTAYNLYFTVSGAGADLTIICNFDTITPNN